MKRQRKTNALFWRWTLTLSALCAMALVAWVSCTANVDEVGQPDTANQPNEVASQQPAGSQDNSRGLVYSIDVEPDHVVEFYEPAERLLVTKEVRRMDQASVFDDRGISNRSPVDIFQAIRPNQEVPQALIDLDERTAVPGFSSEAQQSATTPLQPVEADSFGDSAPDADQEIIEKATWKCPPRRLHCYSGDDCTRVRYCRQNKTGNYYAYANNTTHSEIEVASYTGTIWITAILGGTELGGDSLVGGYIGRWYMRSPYEDCSNSGWMACNPYYYLRTHRWEIDAPSNYHYDTGTGFYRNEWYCDPQGFPFGPGI